MAAELTAGSLGNPVGSWPLRFRPVLQRLVDDGQRYFGGEVALDPVGQVDRPFSTLLRVRILRATTPALRSESGDAFIKILKPRANTEEQIDSMRRNVARDFEMTNQVHCRLARYPGLEAVRPIACFPDELAIVTEEAEGTPLGELLLRRSAGWPADQTVDELTHIIRRVGAWLRAVQAAVPPEGNASVTSPAAIRAYFGRRFDELQQSRGIRLTADGRAALERHLDRLLGDADVSANGNRGVWIHADFCPENILVADGGNRITVLDFTMAKTGTIYHDLAHLHMQLDLMMIKPWFRRGVVARLQHGLLNAFEPGLDEARPLFALALLQHVICHLVTLQGAAGNAMSRFYGARVHGRHRRWLQRVAGLDARSWTR